VFPGQTISEGKSGKARNQRRATVPSPAGLCYVLLVFLWHQLSGLTIVAFLTAAQLGRPVRQRSEIQGVLQIGLAAAKDVFTVLGLDDVTPAVDGRICRPYCGDG